MKLRKALVRHLELIRLCEEWIHERELRVIHHANALRQHCHVESLAIIELTIRKHAVLILVLPTEVRSCGSRLFQLRCGLPLAGLLCVLGTANLAALLFYRIL